MVIMSNMLNNLFLTARKVASGNKMLAEGHKTIAEGWELFEEAYQEADPGDLPQLLRSLKGMSKPMPSPMPMEVIEAGAPAIPGGKVTPVPSPSLVKQEPQVQSEGPVVILVDGKRKWSCPQCEVIMGSKNGCDAHIRWLHTEKALVCALCSYSNYNVDCMHRHKKEHN